MWHRVKSWSATVTVPVLNGRRVVTAGKHYLGTQVPRYGDRGPTARQCTDHCYRSHPAP